jgi:hypothetical protein
MQKGWDVDFVDYAGEARFDFLARYGAAEIEIECKTTSNDTGRKIHRREVNRLADLLLPVTQQLIEHRGCHRILLTVPDRLGKAAHELSSIASTVSAAVKEGMASSDLVQANYIVEALDSWPEPDRDREAAIAFFEERFGRQNSHLLLHGRRGFSVVAVMIASEKADSVVDTISEQAKEAAAQCSGTRPALIALHLVDQISRADLQTILHSQNGLHTITHAVFKGPSRLHVDSIAFTFPQITLTHQAGARWLSGNLPLPDRPTTITNGWSRTLPTSWPIGLSGSFALPRPKKNAESSSRKASRPR